MADLDVSARLAARRARQRQRSPLVRGLATIAGMLLAGAGVVLVVPLPEAGVPLLLGGLRLLSLEFDWAARAQVRVERGWARARAAFDRQPPVVRIAISLSLILAVAAFVVWLVRR